VDSDEDRRRGTVSDRNDEGMSTLGWVLLAITVGLIIWIVVEIG
jgi:hypothetical protein